MTLLQQEQSCLRYRLHQLLTQRDPKEPTNAKELQGQEKKEKRMICTFGGSISSQYCPAERPSCSASTYSCSCLSLSSMAYPCMLVESCEDSNRRNSCNPDHTQTAARAEFDTIAPCNRGKGMLETGSISSMKTF